ncbi:MAG: hypothetical protein JJ850_15530 [Kordiimonadaceae bacterium]|nr:hypothetical protein [Kordiimonadaceae bacterium]MBO6569871.1 hypothetical protein [Kordiimonadaceae bacterium]MBO6966033.1 hypothetical protein [Kordiimonadaceae bacterium]
MTSVTDLVSTINADQPLLVVDADEVLLRFVEHLESYFLDNGFELRLTSFQLTGNIYDQATGVAASPTVVKDLIGGFFDERVDSVPAVPGAADALRSLSDRYQIAVLTNVPHHCRARREAALHDMGFKYPVLSNAGEKGPAMQALEQATKGHTVFVDDLPPQLASVAKHAPDVHLVHFVADPRLAALIDKAEHAHVRIDAWPELRSHLHSLQV